MSLNIELICQKIKDFKKARIDGFFTRTGTCLGDICRIVIWGTSDSLTPD